MPWEFALALGWCLAMSFVALGYGEYASARQARGRPITFKERGRNLLILYAIAVAVSCLVFLIWTRLPLPFVFQQLRVVALIALAPLVLWYTFELPLKLVRFLARHRKKKAGAMHPFEGPWSQDPSFLDRITRIRAHRSAVEPDNTEPDRGNIADRRGTIPSSALDRVAQLQSVERPPAERHGGRDQTPDPA